ncbi:MAG: hypothetical protein RO257_14125 [Candidatus Kapabacteria bacterium]|nr:hypothetical protein [Candidatus Kapabacteria bacterium]
MAGDSDILRNYRMTDGKLALLANTIVIAMKRDLPEFEQYAIASANIDSFSDMIDEFQALPVDDNYRYELSYAVELKKSARNSILNIMRSISFRAKSVFGANSAKYRSMTKGTPTLMPDNILLAAARQVHSEAVNNATELEAAGVSTSYLAAFDSAVNTFETEIDNVFNKKITRDFCSESKIKKGNELYALMVKYCDFGKLIWSKNSPSKYNDYVIYSTTAGAKKSRDEIADLRNDTEVS